MTFGIGMNFGLVGTVENPSSPGLSVVRFHVLDNGTPVEGAIVHVGLEEKNPTVDAALVSRVEHVARTDENGIVDVEMIQASQFTRGGVYRIKVSDPNGRRLHERRVTVPAVDSMVAEDLLDADE
ncbi:MAG: hypothetical protein IT422_05125 [Pirellulaceae bacterium]|nr:hypothetical protein [Pirellulaceae bacterium]